MNIKEAKEQIKNAMTAYFTKDEFGSYAVPVEKQRPVFLMGPPGIGKTAIMEQIAQELDVCLVSYSMTHHTRQSALGLPFIPGRAPWACPSSRRRSLTARRSRSPSTP